MVIQKLPQTANIQLLEQQKENIQPLSGGRSATKLTKALSSRPNSATSINYQEHRTKLEREREELEQKLLDSDELDDQFHDNAWPYIFGSDFQFFVPIPLSFVSVTLPAAQSFFDISRQKNIKFEIYNLLYYYSIFGISKSINQLNFKR